jgi:GntR family transcriptional regulator, transcriptional repressor for pyruvate dehydrogenase complex
MSTQPEANLNLRRQLPPLGQDVRAPKTAALIARSLRRLIFRGELREGDALPSENDLREQFNVSRPTLREALRILESEGLVVVRRGLHGGAYVQVPTVEAAARQIGSLLQYRGTTLLDFYEARAILEAPAAGLAARRRSKADLERLRGLVAYGRSRGANLEVMDAHHDFHMAVVELSGSQTLIVLSAMIAVIEREANASFATANLEEDQRQRLWRRGQRAHDEVIRLIAERDAEGATQHWRTHLIASADVLRRAVPETSVLELLV